MAYTGVHCFVAMLDITIAPAVHPRHVTEHVTTYEIASRCVGREAKLPVPLDMKKVN